MCTFWDVFYPNLIILWRKKFKIVTFEKRGGGRTKKDSLRENKFCGGRTVKLLSNHECFKRKKNNHTFILIAECPYAEFTKICRTTRSVKFLIEILKCPKISNCTKCMLIAQYLIVMNTH